VELNIQSRTPSSGGGGMRQYLIADAAGGSLSYLLPELQADTGVQISRSTGPADNPDTLTATMSDDRMRELRRKYQGRIIVEPDLELNY
jgi:hypothetical protein